MMRNFSSFAKLFIFIIMIEKHDDFKASVLVSFHYDKFLTNFKQLQLNYGDIISKK